MMEIASQETLLLGNSLAPITSEIGFLEVDAARAANAFISWQGPLHTARGVSFEQRAVCGSLEELLRQLLPLSAPGRSRYLFVPTAGKWNAFFDNGVNGTDAVSTISYLAQAIGCRGLRVVAIPDTIRAESGAKLGRYGATILELYGPRKTDFLNYERSIAVVHDGSRWEFDATGKPLPFEQLVRYSEEPVQQRFTPEMLRAFAHELLGIDPFDERAYAPDGEAILVEKVGPVVEGYYERSLEEVRATF